MYSNNQLYLVHHGIQGQKWGVRNAEWYPIAEYKEHLRNGKYRNADGSLNEYGKKVTKAMVGIQLGRAKAIGKARANKANKYDLYNRADDRATNYMNNVGIDEYNREFDKKHGIVNGKKNGKAFDYGNDPEYNDEIWDYYEDILEEALDMSIKEYTMRTKEMENAMILIDHYLDDDTSMKQLSKDYDAYYRRLAKFISTAW